MDKQSFSKKLYRLTLLPFLFVIWSLIKIGSLTQLLFGKIVFILGRVLILAVKLPFSVFNKTGFLFLNLFGILKNQLKKLWNYKVSLPKFELKPQKPKIADPKVLKIEKKVFLELESYSEKARKKKSTLFSKIPFFKRRGRPRTKPLIPSLAKKTAKSLDRIFPWPVKLAFFLLVFLTLFFGYSVSLVILTHDLPSPKKLSDSGGPETTEFYDRKGNLLYRLYEGKNRTPVDINDLPENLVKATISMEDKNFYAHSGIDMYGIGRAVLAFAQNREVQGGSTITQQLIKNTLLTPERTFIRKIKEVALAFWAERIYSKNEILQMYFNEVPYGGPAWGIAAASQTYFDKKPKDLNLAESAYLAGLPASPTTFSPYGTNPELGKSRQKEVLRRMTEEGYITREQADSAYAQKLEIKSPVNSIKAPHFVMYTRQVLAEKYGEKVVSQGGLRIVTSLDLDIQDMAERVVSEEIGKLSYLNVSNGAAMINDAKTGQILAMVGSKNYWDPNGGNFNVATALRQPGSSIKPITYATAFKQGYSPGTTMLDTPVTFKNAWESYSPVNYDGRFHGAVTIRQALGSSFNIPAVKMLAIVGIPEMISTAKDLGITTFNDPDRYGLSLTLGGGEVRLIDMMSAYGTFSQNGLRHDSNPVLKITDSKGNVLEDNTSPKGIRSLSESVAYLITSILSDDKARIPAFGPNSLLNVPGHTVAVKTGTTDSKRDNWTFGYTPQYVVGVWVGNNDNSPMNPQLASGITGAAPIWNRLMTNMVKDKPDLAFVKPADVSEGVVEGHKDLVINNQTTKYVIGQTRRRIKDDKTNSDKDVITFTDPFSTFQSDQSGQPIVVAPNNP